MRIKQVPPNQQFQGTVLALRARPAPELRRYASWRFSP